LTSLSKFIDDVPLGPVASYAFFFHFNAFLFISLPISPSINSLTTFSTSSRFVLLSIPLRIPHSVQANLQVVCCSAKNGQQTIGTPQDKLSTVEFHPMCGLWTHLMMDASELAPVDTNLPLDLFLESLPGTQAAKSRNLPLQDQALLSTRMFSCCYKVPKQTQLVDSLESSHCKHPGSSIHRLLPMEARSLFCGTWLRSKLRGPMV